MISDEDLELARSAQEAFLPSQCTVVRRTLSVDGSGSMVPTETTSVRPCRYSMSTHLADQQVAGSVNETEVYRVTFAFGSDVQKGDRIDVNGESLEILGAYSSGDLRTATYCICVARP